MSKLSLSDKVFLYGEIHGLYNVSNESVEKYIDLLEKAYVIFRLPALNRDVRNEIKKGKKIYFIDCGIRNAILNNFSPLNSRQDVGVLWENYIISERIKYTRYNKTGSNHYFWRTTQQQEIDLIEERNDSLEAFEFKWKDIKGYRFPSTFTSNYPGAKTHTISPENMEEFIPVGGG